MLPHFKSLSSDTDTILQTCLDTQLIIEFQAQVNKLNVDCHNKIKFQHVISKKENGDGVMLPLVPHAVKVLETLTVKAKRSKNTK